MVYLITHVVAIVVDRLTCEQDWDKVLNLFKSKFVEGGIKLNYIVPNSYVFN